MRCVPIVEQVALLWLHAIDGHIRPVVPQHLSNTRDMSTSSNASEEEVRGWLACKVPQDFQGCSFAMGLRVGWIALLVEHDELRMFQQYLDCQLAMRVVPFLLSDSTT